MVLSENQQIGTGLIILGILFIIFGVILLFDSSLIAIGNFLFLIGLVLIIGMKGTFSLFTR